MHQDLKPHNFFVFQEDDTIIAKIGDCDSVVEENSPKSCSTEGYLAPELQAIGRVTKATDIYAMGICLWHILGPLIIDSPTLVSPKLGPIEIKALRNLVLRMKDPEPTKRPTAAGAKAIIAYVLRRIPP